VLGLQVAGIIVGAVVIEQLFSLPGIGRMLVADVGQRDLRRCRASCSCSPGFVLVIGFVVDLVHRVIDPRQRRPNEGSPGSRGWPLVAVDGSVRRRRRARHRPHALLARFWTPFDPQKVDVANRWDAPGIPHLLGTDGSGRDILSLLMAGARTTVWVALGAGLVATSSASCSPRSALTRAGCARASRCSSTS
jgi:hypothetical protein